jgi:phage shock protein PspC (stress-responsive transcriptional regulator)
MNKTETVSIGRKGFVCDLDAYKVLQDYLSRSEKRLHGDPDKKEILADLELSMAGHLAELSGELVIDRETASKVVELMGEVEGADGVGVDESEEDSNPEGQVKSFWSKVQEAVKKPLKKDKTRAIADGVCAGLGKAIDVDPFWIRLVFVVLTLISQGAFIAVYIILIFLMNEDTTVPRRKANEVVNDFKTKLKFNEQASLREYERVGRSLVVGIMKFVWVVLKVVVCTILVVVSVAWASVLIFMLTNPSQIDVFGGSPSWLGFTAVFSAGLLLLIPLFELLLGLFGLVKTRSGLTVTLWSIWALALIVCAASFSNLVPNIREYLVRERPKNDFVYVQMAGKEIASLCISPLGTCSDSEQILTYEPICGRNMTVYDKDDRVVWLMRGWNPNYESIEYPASEESYCTRLRAIYDQGTMMVARQTLNDRAYVSNSYSDTTSPEFPQGISVPSEKEYWQFEYLTQN